MSIRIIKGGKFVDHSTEVRLTFGRLATQAAYHKQTDELDELQDLYQECFIDSSDHELLLEMFKRFEHLLSLPPAPFSFVGEFIEQLEDELSNRKSGLVNDAG